MKKILMVFIISYFIFMLSCVQGNNTESPKDNNDTTSTTTTTTTISNTDFDSSKDLKINVQKKDAWSTIIMWYDQHADGSWETSKIGDENTLMTEYKTGWYTRTFKNTSKMKFLFNGGNWDDKIIDKITATDFNYEDGAGEIWITQDGAIYKTDPSSITIYVEKPSDWAEIWMWFDQNKDGSWETATLKQKPGDMEEYTGRAGWYKKTFENTTKLQFLFNNGTWDKKLADGGSDGGDFAVLEAGQYWITKTGTLSTKDPVGTIAIYFEKPASWAEAHLKYDQHVDSTWNDDKLTSYRPNWFKRAEFTKTMKIEFYFSDGGTNEIKKSGANFLIDTAGEYWIKNDGTILTVDPWVDPDEGILFNSRETKYKSPYGAVTAGTEVTFKFQTYTGVLTGAKLVIERQDIEGDRNISYVNLTSLDMTKTTENTTDFWQAKYTFSNKNVYGYYFEIYIDNYKRYISGAGEKISVAHYKLPKTGGRGVINSTLPNEGEFIQTVYDPNFKTPDWAKDIVFYYIFPDRFRNGSSANDPKQGVDHFYKSDKIEFHTNWADPKPWVPGSGDGHTTDDDEYCNDFYGGDLAGIKEKLDYLAELGVNTLYINPIFEASSNHKYDCANFKSIDNNFGTLEEFNDLCSVAQSKGIKIILDASLNHSSSDSIYMDRYSHYPNSLGAFEGEVKQSTSPYYDWYEWVSGETDPDKMYQIWAVPSLANLKDQTQSYKDFAINDSDSVTKYWLNQGSSGWRMDVAPWVSDSFWKEWRTAAKATKSDSYLVCETWWDSSKYFLGDMFDATMNYIFRQAVIDYSNGTKTAAQTNDILEMMREDYPEEAFYVLMNLLSTHDKPRALWHYGYLEQGASGYDTAVKKLKLSMLFQMTYPGAPSIYYGDEVGVTGGEDPYNRGPYPWADKGGNPDTNLFSQVKTMVKLRNDNPILRRGTIKPIYSDSNVMAYLRTYQGKTAIICVNNSDTNKEVTINLSGLGLPTTFSDILNSNTGYTVTNNQLKVTVNAYWGNVLMN